MAANDHSTDLKDFLRPDGTLIPSVKDKNGVTVTSANVVANTTVTVNIGTAPNANDGDPLRIAFAKMNNFVEASYRVNEIIDSDIQSIHIELDGGVDD